MKKQILALALCFVLPFLSGCGSTSTPADQAAPSRMVTQIDICAEPEDESLLRCYSDKEQLTTIMRMLREMDTGEVPEMSPYQSGEHILYAITITYANGNTNLYHIMDNRYFRESEQDWCQIRNEQTEALLDFIRNNPDH